MPKAIGVAFFAWFLLSLGSAGQAQPPHVARGNDGEIFSIGRGTLFSATATKNNKPAIPNRTKSEMVVGDIEEAIEIISQNYVSPDEARPELIVKAGLNSMLRSLDPHSSYYDKAEFEDLLSEQKSEYFGTGLTISDFERDGILESYVLSTVPGSDAERAGLRFGDRIIAVNGSVVAGFTSRDIRNLIRGPLGTSVRITVERAGKLLAFDLRRAKIQSPTVSNATIISDGVGLIAITEGFSFTTPTEFDSALARLKSAGMRSLIIDLRGNPGGVLESAIRVAEKFLPAGTTIVSQRGRGIYDNRVWQSQNRRPETMPLIVLVNEDTASASEVVAGALQDNDRALIIGEKTFGKGLVQTVLNLPDGGGLTLTTARYFTPSGRLIQRDYEKMGNYDYYRHAEMSRSDRQKASKTRTNRIVYGGDGITPDIKAADEPITANRVALIDPVFFLSRDILDGKFADLSPSAAINTAGEQKFKDLLIARLKSRQVPVRLTDADMNWAITRLKFNIILATEGRIAAERYLLQTDRIVQTALSSLPDAVTFAQSTFTPRQAGPQSK